MSGPAAHPQPVRRKQHAMSAYARRSAVCFAALIALGSVALSGIIVLAAASVLPPSEALVGIGLSWIQSIPAIAVLACTVPLFRRYTALESAAQQLGMYCLAISAVAVAAPMLTYFTFVIFRFLLES